MSVNLDGRIWEAGREVKNHLIVGDNSAAPRMQRTILAWSSGVPHSSRASTTTIRESSSEFDRRRFRSTLADLVSIREMLLTNWYHCFYQQLPTVGATSQTSSGTPLEGFSQSFLEAGFASKTRPLRRFTSHFLSLFSRALASHSLLIASKRIFAWPIFVSRFSNRHSHRGWVSTCSN